VSALPVPSVVVTSGASAAKLPLCEKLTFAPGSGTPRSSTVAIIWSLPPLAAGEVELANIEIEVGVVVSDGDTWAVKVPLYVCLGMLWHSERFALGQGMKLRVIFPVTGDPIT
jgi:hypothetical protein